MGIFKDWGGTIIGAAGSLIGQGIQQGGGAVGTKKQYERSRKLMEYQDQMNRSMALFNNQNQMQMWRETGPVGQMQQLKEAGLNPGLIYGMGGAGGQTAAAAQGSGPGLPSVSKNDGADWGMSIGQAAQTAVMMAQKRNIEEDTKGKMIDNQNKAEGGVGYENIAAQTRNLNQGVTNAIAQKEYTESQTELNKIQAKIQSGTVEEQIASIIYEMQNLAQTNRMLVRNNFIDAQTAKTKIQQATAQLTQTITEINLRKAQTRLTEEQIKQVGQNIYNSIIARQQDWEKININWAEVNQKIKESSNRTNNADMSDTERMVWESIQGLFRGAANVITQ